MTRLLTWSNQDEGLSMNRDQITHFLSNHIIWPKLWLITTILTWFNNFDPLQQNLADSNCGDIAQQNVDLTENGEYKRTRRTQDTEEELKLTLNQYISIVEILLNKMLNWPKRRRTLRRGWSSQCHKTLFSRQRLVTYISPPAFRQAWVRSNKLLQTSFSDEFKVWQLF